MAIFSLLQIFWCANIVTNDYIYKFFLENGTELNQSSPKEDYYIDVYALLIDLESSYFNYSKYFAELGYDIYLVSDFYNYMFPCLYK